LHFNIYDSDTLVLALATLGEATEIWMILIAKVSKEGDITGIFAYKPCQCKRAFKQTVELQCDQIKNIVMNFVALYHGSQLWSASDK
jgi:hypothetical protein